MKILSVVIFSALIIALPLLGQSCFAAATMQETNEEEVAPLEGKEKERAVQLIRQLGNADYEARQKATRELWSIGKPALSLLGSAAQGSLSREARMRSKDLLILIEVGLSPDTDPEIVNCVSGFLDRELAVQERAVKKLVHLQQHDVAEKLSELLPSQSDREALKKLLSMPSSEAEVALRLGRDDQFRDWIENPATRESQKLLYHYCLWVDGKLDQEIERLIKEAEGEIKEADEYEDQVKKNKKKLAGKKVPNTGKSSVQPPKQNRLKTLVGLLRFLERWDEALEWAGKVYNPDRRRNLTHSILMESGNWKGLEGLIVEDAKEKGDSEEAEAEKDSRGPHNGLAYEAKGYKKAIVEYYAGSEKEFDATISAIEKDIEEEFQKQKRMGAKPKRGNHKHAQFLRYALDFERALKFSSLEKDRATFAMLRRHSRYEKLLDVFNLQTYEKRTKYFKGRSRHIRSLQYQVENFTEKNDDENRERYVEKRDSAVYDWRETCRLLADLGFDEEAELYSRKLYFDMRNKVALGTGTVQDLARMGAYDSAWEIATLECDRVDTFSPLASLLNPYGFNHEAAQLLDLQFKKKIDDRIERCRKVASLIRSPAVPQQEGIDFWSEISEVDLATNANSVLHLFLIWDVKEQELVRRSRNNQNKPVEELVDERELLQAAQDCEAQALVDEGGSMLNYARAWYAYSKVGEAERARRMRLLFALKFDPEDAYDYTSGYTGTSWQCLPFDLYRMYDCLENDKVGINCYYMWKMTQNDSNANIAANQKMVRTQIVRLRYIDSPYFDESETDHPTFIEGAIRSGDIDAARRWFKKLSNFEPANSSFVEKNFPLFEKLGNDEFVDEVFQKVSADFYEILERFPKSAVHLNNYAWACACAKRNVKNGIQIAKQAVELRPALSGHRDTLAELYHIDGQHDKAIETIRRAIEINPMKPYYVEQLEKFRKAKEAASKSATN